MMSGDEVGTDAPVVERVTALVVTFRRAESLMGVLEGLQAQTRPPDHVVVIDNDADPDVQRLVVGASRPGRQLAYVALPGNSGPAGGFAAGIDLLQDVDVDPRAHWVLLVDDDDPPDSPTTLADLVRLLERAADPRVACVGLVGARLDRRSGLLVRLPDDEMKGLVDVDYVGNGMYPLYQLAALQHVGGFDPRLFFGEEEVDVGLRLRASGRRLVIDGDEVLERRRRKGRIGLRVTRWGTPPGPTWRRYYSVRNHTDLLRRHVGGLTAAKYAGLVLAKSALAAVTWRGDGAALVATARGVADAARGRRGKTIDPLDHGGNPAKPA